MATPERLAEASPHAKIQQPPELPALDDFLLLLTVIQTGSFGRAAKALGIGQPTVSRRIERLELLMGASLVERSNSGAKPTVEGLRIVEELHVARDAVDRAMRLVHAATGPRTETVKFITTDGIATFWMARFLPKLYDHCEHLDFRVYTTSEAGQDQKDHYDLSIHFWPPNDPNAVVVPLGNLHFLPYASKDYLAKYGTPQNPAELAQHRLIDFALYLIDKGTWKTRLPTVSGEAQVEFFTNSSGLLAESIRQGLGIGWAPTYASVFEPELVPLEIGLHHATPFYLCYYPDALNKRSVRIVIQFLKHIFSRRMPWFADAFVPPAQFPKVSPASIMANFSLTPKEVVADPAAAAEYHSTQARR